MLPIYEVIDVLDVLPANVGHTRPWIVLANTPTGIKKFVAKLYTVEQVQNNCLTNEVVGNILAREFDMLTPEAALLDFPDYLSLKIPPEHQPQFDNADTRLKFGTQEIIGKTFISNLPKPQLNKRISMDTLFAFDNLIRNADRGQQKPNLLITPKDAYLIDHEFILKSDEIIPVDFASFQIPDKFTRHHIFYPYLKHASGHSKQNYFSEFTEYLKYMNYNCLNPYFQQLRSQGFTPNQIAVVNWLQHVKNNSVTFVNLLKSPLQ